MSTWPEVAAFFIGCCTLLTALFILTRGSDDGNSPVLPPLSRPRYDRDFGDLLKPRPVRYEWHTTTITRKNARKVPAPPPASEDPKSRNSFKN